MPEPKIETVDLGPKTFTYLGKHYTGPTDIDTSTDLGKKMLTDLTAARDRVYETKVVVEQVGGTPAAIRTENPDADAVANAAREEELNAKALAEAKARDEAAQKVVSGKKDA